MADLKEALKSDDPEAITARADVLSASGDRAGAIRVLGSVIDVRPGDIAAQKRLARLERWRGSSGSATTASRWGARSASVGCPGGW